jgi:tetratricopeptide (TPR) repeat protein
MAIAGYARLYLGRDEEAVAWYNRVAEIDRNLPNAHFYHAVALAHFGRQEGARAAVADGLEINPSYTIKKFRAGTFSDNPTFLSQRERIYDGMRKAGVPEG